jgi:uncharacterized 2Fe-2S/4Fe-4S cluster protein (DUF4445 family)
MPGVSVRFEPSGTRVEVPRGTTLHAAAALAGIRIDAPCGGEGRCGSCRVAASGGIAPPDTVEIETLGIAATRGTRLACRARVEGPAEVVVETPRAAGATRVQMSGLSADLDVEDPASRGIVVEPGVRALGAAVDLGTTTIAVRLHDLGDGRVLGEIADLNPQVAWGHDVLSRVSRAVEGEAEELREAVVRKVETLVSLLACSPRAAAGSLREIVVVGNPAMTRLFLGDDVASLGDGASSGEPRPARVTDTVAADLSSLGEAAVIVGPEVSPFIGSDALAGLIATRLDGRTDDAILLDLGTNGEVVLVSQGGLFAASAAAGPAFEGYGLTDGMRAEPGAIETVWLAGDEFGEGTVGDERPKGLCGSGLIDLLAVLLSSGALDSSGRLQMEGPLAARVTDVAEGRVFEVASDVVLTQNDVRQAQLAKGAVQAAIESVLIAAGRGPGDVREVLVAGGFGSHLRPASLAAVGIVPPEWAERVTLAGNAALAGASAMLLSGRVRENASRLAASVRTVALAQDPDFQRRFIQALAFPEVPRHVTVPPTRRDR